MTASFYQADVCAAPQYQYVTLDGAGPCTQCRKSIRAGSGVVQQGDRTVHELCYRRATRGRYW